MAVQEPLSRELPPDVFPVPIPNGLRQVTIRSEPLDGIHKTATLLRGNDLEGSCFDCIDWKRYVRGSVERPWLLDAEDVINAMCLYGHNGFGKAHGFEDHVGKSFPPRVQDQRIAVRDVMLRLGLPANEVDSIGDSERFCESFEIGTLDAIANQDKMMFW
jgi:hypothetical protein